MKETLVYFECYLSSTVILTQRPYLSKLSHKMESDCENYFLYFGKILMNILLQDISLSHLDDYLWTTLPGT